MVDDPTLPTLSEVATSMPNHEWHPRTDALWEAWRRDPATTQYGPAEVASAVELIWLFEEFVGDLGSERKFDRVSASELRLRMDGLGLTAKGKRDLRWRAPTEHAASDPAAPAPLAEVRRLRAIDPAA